MIKEFETELIDAITEGISTFKTTRGYGGDFNVNNMGEILSVCPAALVVYDGSEIAEVNRRQARIMTWSIIIADESLGDNTSRRSVYDLLESVKACLDGVEFTSFQMKPLAMMRERISYKDAQITVYIQEYRSIVFSLLG